MHYHHTTISLAVLTLVFIAASASLPRTNWHHHYGQASQAAAVENSGYPQQGSNGVSAPVSQSGGVSGDHGKDKSYDASPKASRVDYTFIPKEVEKFQQAASMGSDRSADGGADKAAAPIEKASGQAASTRDSTCTDQSSSSTGSSNTKTNNSTVAAGASVSSRKGARLW